MSSHPCFIIDAFNGIDPRSGARLLGNPAAVVLLKAPAEDTWMQTIAAEFNLSETTFLVPLPKGRFNLRWFTPEVEVPLCGHATLAAAFALWEGQGLESSLWEFETKSGVLKVARSGPLLHLDFPVRTAELIQDIGYLRPHFPMELSAAAMAGGNLLIEVKSAQALANYQPQFNQLQSLAKDGVLLTSISDNEDFDFVSRYFAPNKGIPEDPVTGSAHCLLADYWQRKLNKNAFVAKQCSQRGGIIHLTINNQRVQLSGTATLVMRGELLNPLP